MIPRYKQDQKNLFAYSRFKTKQKWMSKPILYIKQGCPWCSDALEYFAGIGLELELIDVRTDPSKMSELEAASGQSKTPTLKNGDFVVADFDINEFKDALRANPEEAQKLGLSL